MAEILLQAKLLIPPQRSALVARPRLLEHLDAGLRPGHKLTLISAPAGYGKTTLVATWLETLSTLDSAHTNRGARNTAWLSLDEHDNEPARFLAYLVAALQRVSGELGERLHGLLDLPRLPPLESLLALLLDDLTAFPSPLVLVLDDLHELTDPGLHDALHFWLEHQPPQVHTVLITRQDPPLPLARWRVRGQLTELRQHDLSFTSGETAAFLQRSMGISLSGTDLAALEQRTEGWIAGLQMAALALQHADQGEAAKIIAGFSGRHHFVLDYLTDEVLRRQPAHVRAFLMRTCILEQMSGPLCDHLLSAGDDSGLTGEWRACDSQAGNAQAVLERLEHANLFVVPLDKERTWYRYHRLFAELLRARLRAVQPGEIPGLHRRAAIWYEREGWGAQAVHHALETGDARWAAELIERVLQQQTTISRLDATSLLAWLAALPPEQLCARPRLQILAARAYYVTGQRNRAERTLDDLERMLSAAPDPAAQAQLASIAADRASYAAMRGDVRLALEWAQPALAALPVDGASGEAPAARVALARFRPASVLGLAHLRAGNVTEASRAFELAIAAAEQAGVPVAAVLLLCNLAQVRVVQGRLRSALACCDRADQLAADNALPPAEGSNWGAGLVRSIRAEVAFERGHLDEAASHARQALVWVRQSRVTLGQETLYGLLARVELARGQRQAAETALEQGLRIAQGNDIPRLRSLSAAGEARVRLAQDEIDAAARWAETYAASPATEYLREFEDLTLIRVELARRRPLAAQAALDRLLPSAQAAGRWGPAVEALALRALALQAEGEPDSAIARLSQALEHAAPEEYTRPFVESGAPMQELLVKASRRADSEKVKRYADQLLAAFQPRRPALPISQATPDQLETLVELLTAREIDVLGLLAQGLTNAEIGRQLVISLPTVKSHTRNLYAKLDVHTRREAVTRARELGLLEV